MSILDQDLGFREITIELLEGIGFKPISANMWINGVRVYPYNLFLRIPGEPQWSGKRHLIRYYLNESRLEIFENKDAWSYTSNYELQVNCFEDIIAVIGKYK